VETLDRYLMIDVYINRAVLWNPYVS